MLVRRKRLAEKVEKEGLPLGRVGLRAGCRGQAAVELHGDRVDDRAVSRRGYKVDEQVDLDQGLRGVTALETPLGRSNRRRIRARSRSS